MHARSQLKVGSVLTASGYGGYEKSCMTLSSLFLGNYSTIVYSGHAGFLVSTVVCGSRCMASLPPGKQNSKIVSAFCPAAAGNVSKAF